MPFPPLFASGSTYSNRYDLDKLDVLIDENYRSISESTYFEVIGIPSPLTYGKHYFTISFKPNNNLTTERKEYQRIENSDDSPERRAGAVNPLEIVNKEVQHYLREGSPVLFEFKDSEDNVIFSDLTTFEDIDGSAVAYVWVKQDPLRNFNDIQNGFGTFTIVAELDNVPVDWVDTYNYRCSVPVEIQKDRVNTSPILFQSSSLIGSSLELSESIHTDKGVLNQVTRSYMNISASNLDTFGGQVKYVEVSYMESSSFSEDFKVLAQYEVTASDKFEVTASSANGLNPLSHKFQFPMPRDITRDGKVNFELRFKNPIGEIAQDVSTGKEFVITASNRSFEGSPIKDLKGDGNLAKIDFTNLSTAGKNKISGSFGNLSGSLHHLIGKTALSSSNQIKDDISGSSNDKAPINSPIFTGTATFTENVALTGSILVKGAITSSGEFSASAITADLVEISGSVIFSSGSNIFGDSKDDVHDFSGSANIIAGDFKVTSGSTTLMKISSSQGKVGFGTEFPTKDFEFKGDISSSGDIFTGKKKVIDEDLNNLATTGKNLISGSFNEVSESISTDFGFVKGKTVISSSGQVKDNLPAGALSSSQQFPSGIISGTKQLPSNIVSSSTQTIDNLPAGSVSGSSQVDYTGLSSTPDGIISSSNQVKDNLPDGALSSSKQLPAGTVSGSSQVDYTGLTSTPGGILSSSQQFPANIVSSSTQVKDNLPSSIISSSQQFPSGIISGTKQLPDGILSSSQQLPAGTVSSSGQVSYDEISSIPNAIISSSQQFPSNILSSSQQFPSGIISGTKQLPDGILSSSQQFPSGIISGTKQLPDGILSSSQQFPSNIVSSSGQVTFGDLSSIPNAIISSSQQFPSGIISGTKQLPDGIISGTQQFPSNIVSSSNQVPDILPGGTISSSQQFPSNIVSSSQQFPSGIISGTKQLPSGIISGTQQFPSNIVSSSNQVPDILPTGTISSSQQFPSGIISGTKQLPDGIVSSSTQTIDNLPGGTISGSTQVSFDGIADKPTTVAGYGITDTVISSSTQIKDDISGSFTNTSASLAASINANDGRNLKAHWTFDNVTNPFGDTTGNGFTASFGDNPGTDYETRDGIIGKSLHIGKGEGLHLISHSIAGGTESISGYPEFSFTLWLKPDSVAEGWSSTARILSRDYSDYWMVGVRTGSSHPGWGTDGYGDILFGNSSQNSYIENAIITGSWNFIALRMNQTLGTGSIVVYRGDDGSARYLEETSDKFKEDFPTDVANTRPVGLAGNVEQQVRDNPGVVGEYDDVRFYNKQLSNEEVFDLYNLPNTFGNNELSRSIETNYGFVKGQTVVSSSGQVTFGDLSSIPNAIISSSQQFPSGIISGTKQLPSGIVSGTQQFPSGIISGTQQFPSGIISGTQQFPSGIISGTKQLPSGIVSGTQQFPSGIISGTQQFPSNIVSSSDQVPDILPGGTISSSQQFPSGIISGTKQLPSGIISGTQQFPSNILSSSQQFPSNILSSSQQFPSGIISGTKQLPDGILSSSQQLPAGTVSSSGQVTFGDLSSIPNAIISSSQQFPSNILSSSQQFPSGIISGTKQFPSGIISGTKQLPDGILSSSQQFPSNILSSSQQFPSGIISGAKQLPAGTVSSSGQVTFGDLSSIPNAIVSSSQQFPSGIISGTQQFPSGIISGTKQLPDGIISGTQQFPSNILSSSQQFPSNILSSSQQFPSGIISGAKQLPAGTVSSSGQVTYDEISSIPNAIISSSQQFPSGIISGTKQLPDGILSSSQQFPSGIISGTKQLPDGILSSSQQFPSNILSSSQQFPSGIISGTKQLPDGIISGTQQFPSNILSSSQQFPSNIVSSSQQFPSGIISGTQQFPSGIISGTKQLPDGIISGTQQFPSNIVSSSQQFPSNILSSSQQFPSGIISGTKQFPSGIISGTKQLPDGILSSSQQFPSNIVSSSQQFPSGIISGTKQLPDGILSSSQQFPANIVSSSGQVTYTDLSSIPGGIASSSAQVVNKLVGQTVSMREITTRVGATISGSSTFRVGGIDKAFSIITGSTKAGLRIGRDPNTLSKVGLIMSTSADSFLKISASHGSSNLHMGGSGRFGGDVFANKFRLSGGSVIGGSGVPNIYPAFDSYPSSSGGERHVVSLFTRLDDGSGEIYVMTGSQNLTLNMNMGQSATNVHGNAGLARLTVTGSITASAIHTPSITASKGTFTDLSVSGDISSPSTVTTTQVVVSSDIVHQGDTHTSIDFGEDTISIEAGGSTNFRSKTLSTQVFQPLTASIISSSGTIFAKGITIKEGNATFDDGVVINDGGGGESFIMKDSAAGILIAANYSGNNKINIGNLAISNNHSLLNVDGDLLVTSHITASGNISASGNITSSGLQVDGDVDVSGKILGKHTDVKFHAYQNTGTTEQYIPMQGTREQAVAGGSVYYTEWVAPYDGQIEKVIVMTSNSSGTTAVKFRINGGIKATQSETVGAATPVTFETLSGHPSSVADRTFDAGDLLQISIDPTNAPGDVNVTTVWVYNIDSLTV